MRHFVTYALLFLLIPCSTHSAELREAERREVDQPKDLLKDTAKSTSLTPAEKNLAEGRTFLDQNKLKPGVITLPSGLQYSVLQEGNGTPPGPTDFVTVNYQGSLINGNVFDSTDQKGPATFAVNAVIPGWTEALQLMKPGAKWKIFLPANLAYGEQGAGNLIGPNSTLIFTIELVSVKSALDETGGPSQDMNEDL